MNNGSALNGKSDFVVIRELWMWRGMAIFLLMMLLIVNFITFTIDRSQHAKDNAERAATWQELKAGANSNRAMILKNYDAILKNSQDVNELRNEVRRCASCHGHRRGTPLVSRERPAN